MNKLLRARWRSTLLERGNVVSQPLLKDARAQHNGDTMVAPRTKVCLSRTWLRRRNAHDKVTTTFVHKATFITCEHVYIRRAEESNRDLRWENRPDE